MLCETLKQVIFTLLIFKKHLLKWSSKWHS